MLIKVTLNAVACQHWTKARWPDQPVSGFGLYPILGRRCRPRTWTGSDPGSFVSDPGTCSSRSTDNNLNELIFKSSILRELDCLFPDKQKGKCFLRLAGNFFPHIGVSNSLQLQLQQQLCLQLQLTSAASTSMKKTPNELRSTSRVFRTRSLSTRFKSSFLNNYATHFDRSNAAKRHYRCRPLAWWLSCQSDLNIANSIQLPQGNHSLGT